ncbi:MAG: helix-turn-helix domain-containing protein [Armatimonadetes bacterium]|nr:helix-turn-helix domain-containing protein [Armatimonadota bacterium]
MLQGGDGRPPAPALADVLAVFQALTGLRAVARTEAGRPLEGEDPPPRLCRLMRGARANTGRQECIASAAPPALGSPRLFECPCGLLGGIARVPAPEGGAALVTCGQVLDADGGAEGRAELVRRGGARGVAPGVLRAALREMKAMTRGELGAALDLLASMLRWRAVRAGAVAPRSSEASPDPAGALTEALRGGDRLTAANVAPGVLGRDLHTRAAALRLTASICEAASGAFIPLESADRIATRAAREIASAACSEEIGAVVRRVLAAVLGAPEPPPGAAADAVRRAAEYIEAHYDHDLTLPEVARHAGLSPAYFSALFKREIGIGFRCFLTQARLAAARRLLEESGRSVEEVAAAAGFNDAHYFSRVFSRSFGLPPGRFRQRHRRATG